MTILINDPLYVGILKKFMIVASLISFPTVESLKLQNESKKTVCMRRIFAIQQNLWIGDWL